MAAPTISGLALASHAPKWGDLVSSWSRQTSQNSTETHLGPHPTQLLAPSPHIAAP